MFFLAHPITECCTIQCTIIHPSVQYKPANFVKCPQSEKWAHKLSSKVHKKLYNIFATKVRSFLNINLARKAYKKQQYVQQNKLKHSVLYHKLCLVHDTIYSKLFILLKNIRNNNYEIFNDCHFLKINLTNVFLFQPIAECCTIQCTTIYPMQQK